MFKTRVLSSVVLVILALVTILGGGWLLAATLLFLAMMAYRELAHACGWSGNQKKVSLLELVGYVGIAAYYLVMVLAEDRTFLFLTVMLMLMGFMFVYVFSFPKYHSEQVMSAFFCAVYAPVMLSFIYLVRELPYGIYTVWMIFISSWICDTCAYLTGSCIGKHKLAPVLSPKKSIEGAIGGIAGSAIVGAVYGYFVVEKVITEQEITWIFVLISAAGAVISQVGDLAASAIKRNREIKDYGKLIPGHGGVMDRFDSVIFTAPMIYFLTLLLIRA